MLWYVVLALFSALSVVVGLAKFRLANDYTVRRGGGIFFRIFERYGDWLTKLYIASLSVIAALIVAKESGNYLIQMSDSHLAGSHPLWTVIFVLPIMLCLFAMLYGFLTAFLVRLGAYLGFTRLHRIRTTRRRNLKIYLRTGVDIDGKSERRVKRHRARE